ncbi:TPR repeat-containing protein [Chthoniobacter flavus Ellin428]|uniref:protein O-GlcNAc transferase n=1 Tax=Chthoniobacter flavus Ellin428 TaxID=497964 RepID=B4D6D8_9BACT|nr:tetratricopeptide repeat protein [Chthoniobacter flavus]EDY18047.1 TPR repeat-containing protein [Chthoniobacter flavus Ellin428]TCO88289.1 putative O-linked N-acetylglucosamine transferase (SPINDLY family) [Chthoniobacter flavus]
MSTAQQVLELGLQHHQAGRLAEAEACYREILEAQPDHLDALHLLGVAAMQTGRAELAVNLLNRVAALVPNHPAVHSNLGEAYRGLGKFEEAVASFRRALQLKPDDVLAQYNLGNVLVEWGKLEEAIAAYRRVLTLKPDYVDAHNNLGIALARQGVMTEATEVLRRALQLAPADAGAWNNFGIVLAEQGRFGEAVEAYRRALELAPNQPEAHNNFGNACKELGQFESAVAAYRRAVELRPDSAEFQANLGNGLREQGRFDEAMAAYRHALALQPKRAETHHEMGNALAGQGQLDAAVLAYRATLELKPDYGVARCNLGNVLRDQGMLDEAIAAYRRAAESKSAQLVAQSNLIYTLHYHADGNEGEIRREQCLWNERFGGDTRPAVRYSNEPDFHRRLRIGYVSPEFRDHVTGRNLWPLFKEHDRTAFEIFCYSGVVRPDGMTQQFRERVDHWRSTLGVSDEELAEWVQRDGVDILVDLTQHMDGNRLAMFGRRPAPVQLSFAGYPEATGVEAIPYRISDRFLEPHSTEDRLLRIDSYWCYDPCGAEIGVNELPVQRNGWVTFGCLNHFCKVNEPTLRRWAKVLRTVRDSKLMLLSPEGSHRRKTWRILESEGVEARRVEFVPRCGRRAYLELYQQMDVALDTFPYNGHTTSLDALWMGVPVVSLAGRSAVSRAGLSQLSNLGLAELVASAEDEFVEIAAALAQDLSRLADLRRTLRARMEASVLMDAIRFTRGIESAYRQMWQRWCEG